MSLPPPNVPRGTYEHLKTKALAPRKVGEDEFDNQVSEVCQYGRPEFWDNNFATEYEPFEWYYGYDVFKSIITDNVEYNEKVMVSGIGSSRMLIDMVEDGYTNVIGNDISRVAIAQQKIKCEEYPQISFFTGNMLDTDLPAASLDAIIDKAVLDSLLCTGQSEVSVKQYIIEVERLLNENGKFIVISNGLPEDRLKFLEQHDIDEPNFTPWTMDVQAVVKPKQFAKEVMDPDNPESLYFMYVMTKTPELLNRRSRKEQRTEANARKKKKVVKTKASNL